MEALFKTDPLGSKRLGNFCGRLSRNVSGAGGRFAVTHSGRMVSLFKIAKTAGKWDERTAFKDMTA